MSKPQLASEPSMEEILASIRKMISDDKPGPSPMPDQMARTPFGGPAKSVSEFNGRSAPAAASQPRATSAQPSNFNSLADALKVATALSDQRRSLQQEIASVLDKGARGTVIDPLGQAAASQGTPATDTGGPQMPNFPDWTNQPAAPAGDEKRDLMSYDFGTVVPQRETPAARSAPEARAAIDKAEIKPDAQPAEEPRIVSMSPRTSSPSGAAMHPASAKAGALNGSSPSVSTSTVAPFPRPARDVAKPAAESPEPAEKSSAALEPARESPTPTSAADQAEALLDAVVDMVQQQPGSLSVFTSGASFIGGIAGSKHSELIAATVAEKVEAAVSTGGAPPKLDRAAAELLRPMLRQWLSDNMPRIVEEALRSELTEQTEGGGKGPGKV